MRERILVSHVPSPSIDVTCYIVNGAQLGHLRSIKLKYHRQTIVINITCGNHTARERFAFVRPKHATTAPTLSDIQRACKMFSQCLILNGKRDG